MEAEKLGGGRGAKSAIPEAATGGAVVEARMEQWHRCHTMCQLLLRENLLLVHIKMEVGLEVGGGC